MFIAFFNFGVPEIRSFDIFSIPRWCLNCCTRFWFGMGVDALVKLRNRKNERKTLENEILQNHTY